MLPLFRHPGVRTGAANTSSHEFWFVTFELVAPNDFCGSMRALFLYHKMTAPVGNCREVAKETHLSQTITMTSVNQTRAKMEALVLLTTILLMDTSVNVKMTLVG